MTIADSQRVGAVVHETHKVTHQAIPSDTATLNLPLESLRNLPEGVTLTQRRGRATAHAAVRDGRLQVTATCDSLQREVEHYAMMAAAYAAQVHQLRDRQTQQFKASKKQTHPMWYHYFLSAIGGLTPIFILLIIRKLKRHVL